jgi:hypothetical protein
MSHSKKLRIIVCLLCCLFMVDSTMAQGRWKVLGKRKVNHLVDHDTIHVTAVRGDFRRIRIRVSKVAVDFHRVVVHYANGGDDTIPMRMRVRAGGYTRVIDLRGSDRVIRSVDFWYDTRGLAGRHGIVTLYGQQ